MRCHTVMLSRICLVVSLFSGQSFRYHALVRFHTVNQPHPAALPALPTLCCIPCVRCSRCLQPARDGGSVIFPKDAQGPPAGPPRSKALVAGSESMAFASSACARPSGGTPQENLGGGEDVGRYFLQVLQASLNSKTWTKKIKHKEASDRIPPPMLRPSHGATSLSTCCPKLVSFRHPLRQQDQQEAWHECLFCFVSLRLFEVLGVLHRKAHHPSTHPPAALSPNRLPQTCRSRALQGPPACRTPPWSPRLKRGHAPTRRGPSEYDTSLIGGAPVAFAQPSG